jgi:CRP-like cAMP-binding protein
MSSASRSSALGRGGSGASSTSLSSAGTSRAMSRSSKTQSRDALGEDAAERGELDHESSGCEEGTEGLLEQEDARLFKVEEADLQTYLTTMRLDKLFAELVEELLVEAPANPVKFMIDFLFTQFPDQAAASSFAKTFPDGGNSMGGGIPLTGLHAASALAVAAASSDDDEAEDQAERKRKKDEAHAVKAALAAAEAKAESKVPGRRRQRTNKNQREEAKEEASSASGSDADEDDEAGAGAARQRKAGAGALGSPAQKLARNRREAAARTLAARQRVRLPARRGAVCGLALGAGEPEVDLRDGARGRKAAQAQSAPDAADRAALRAALKGSLLFAQLRAHELEAALNCFVVVRHRGGDVLWAQGGRESEAAACYVVLEGQLEQQVDGRKVSLKGPGETAGEQALAMDMPRPTSCSVAGHGMAKLGAVVRAPYRIALAAAAAAFRERAAAALRAVPLFATLDELEMARLAEDVCELETLPQGQLLFKQHQPADKMYVLLSGKVRCEQRLSPSEPNVAVELFEAGDWFGEVALITDRPRAAICIADSDNVEALTIDRAAFVRVFGPLTDLLRRDRALFKRFVSDKI